MIWLDSRVEKPHSNSFETYFVTFIVDNEFIFRGFADWEPVDNYTGGTWVNTRHTNGNKQSDGQVLYWMRHPKMPELR